MKIYSSFLVRCWLMSDATDGLHSVFDIEHIQTGEHRRMAALTEAQEWMLAASQNAQTVRSDLQETTEASREL